MAYDIIFEPAVISGVVGLDVSTTDPTTKITANGDVTKTPKQAKASTGREVVEHAAYVIAISLGVLWLAGSTVLKNVKL